MKRIVIDTNIFVAALLSGGGASRQIIRGCLEKKYTPLMGTTLYNEYEDVFSRPLLLKKSPLTIQERNDLFDAFLSTANWITIYFLWRPNAKDEGDNHLIELAVAGNAEAIVTHNLKDLKTGELRFPSFKIVTPAEWVRAQVPLNGVRLT